MILPTALVDRWPGDAYRRQHGTIESSLKHSVADLLRLHNEIKILKRIERDFATSPIPEELLTKDIRAHLKRNGGDSLNQEFIDYIKQRSEEYERCLKFTDYPAMIMGAWPESVFLEKNRYKEQSHNITGAILTRGISSGKICDQHRARGLDYYFVETGYLGNYRCANNQTGRKIYHRIVKNAMQHSTIMDVPDDRWQQLVEFNPNMHYQGWRRPGSKILVVMSSEKPFEYYGANRHSWQKMVERTLRQHTDREIVWREKASRGERTNDTIYHALADDVYALVTYQSVAAVEAIQFGVPAFALAPTAADPVCNKDLKDIEHPRKLSEDVIYRWLCSIAYGQFNLDEILTGRAWQMVLENDERATISC